jgi:lysyl-tRNA synthetase class II
METKKVTKACSVKTDAESEREFKINVTFDFKGVNDEDILNYATSHLMIGRAQSKFRNMSDEALEQLEKHGFTVKVAEGGRLPADPGRAVKKSFAKIEDRKAKLELLEQLQAELDEEYLTDEGENKK